MANYSGGAILRIFGVCFGVSLRVCLISLLKRLAKACLPNRGDGSADASQHIIAEIQDHYRKAIAEETALACAHQSDPYYTSSRGHNVGHDEMVAVIYAEKIVLTPSAAESGDPVSYANRLIDDLEAIKADYRISEDDPDGYGVGTLHSISRKLEAFAPISSASSRSRPRSSPRRQVR